MATNSVIIPLIRKVYPAIVANSIVGVQPMTTIPEISPGVLQTREELFNIYPYIAQRHVSLWDLGFPSELLNQMTEWCTTTLPSGSWHYLTGNFYFYSENDRTMFVLKFG